MQGPLSPGDWIRERERFSVVDRDVSERLRVDSAQHLHSEALEHLALSLLTAEDADDDRGDHASQDSRHPLSNAARFTKSARSRHPDPRVYVRDLRHAGVRTCNNRFYVEVQKTFIKSFISLAFTS